LSRAPERFEAVAAPAPRPSVSRVSTPATSSRSDLYQFLVVIAIAALTLIAFSFFRAHRVGLPGSMLEISKNNPAASAAATNPAEATVTR
jgi:hypothetical protein